MQVHDEREMDRVLGIEGVELIGINNRNLGKLFQLLILVCAIRLILFSS